MKTLQITGAIALLILSACSSTRTAQKNYDDVYYSSNEPNQPPVQETQVNNNPDVYTQAEEPAQQQPDSIITEESADQQGNTYVTNKYYYNDGGYDADDYYDYTYAVRLKRFYHPVYTYGYYDNYYTNSYWYSYDPWDWGLSVYLGYPWWGPVIAYSYPGFSFSFSWGYPYYGYYDPWYNNWHHHWWANHYYPYGYGYYSYGQGCYGGYYSPYWSGYNNGYYNGYNDGYYDGYYGNNPYYYNSYDESVTYYGPRNSYSSNKAPMTVGDKYQQAMKVEKANVSVVPVSTGKPDVVSNPVKTSAGVVSGTKMTTAVKEPVKTTKASSFTGYDPASANNPKTVSTTVNQVKTQHSSATVGNQINDKRQPVSTKNQVTVKESTGRPVNDGKVTYGYKPADNEIRATTKPKVKNEIRVDDFVETITGGNPRDDQDETFLRGGRDENNGKTIQKNQVPREKESYNKPNYPVNKSEYRHEKANTERNNQTFQNNQPKRTESYRQPSYNNTPVQHNRSVTSPARSHSTPQQGSGTHKSGGGEINRRGR